MSIANGSRGFVNPADSERACGLEVVNKTDPIEIIGPSKVLESFIWDPDSISIWLKRTRS